MPEDVDLSAVQIQIRLVGIRILTYPTVYVWSDKRFVCYGINDWRDGRDDVDGLGGAGFQVEREWFAQVGNPLTTPSMISPPFKPRPFIQDQQHIKHQET
jgi:hypothetical protein